MRLISILYVAGLMVGSAQALELNGPERQRTINFCLERGEPMARCKCEIEWIEKSFSHDELEALKTAILNRRPINPQTSLKFESIDQRCRQPHS